MKAIGTTITQVMVTKRLFFMDQNSAGVEKELYVVVESDEHPFVRLKTLRENGVEGNTIVISR